MTEAPDIRQVLVHPVIWPHLELWLATRGLVLGRVPVEDDLPTYAMALAKPGDAEQVLAAGIRDAARTAAARQTTGQTDTEAVAEAERVCALPDWVDCSCNHLTGCEHPHPAVGQPAEAQAACGCGEPQAPGTVHRPGAPCYVQEQPIEARRPDTMWLVMRRGETDWLSASTHYSKREQALRKLEQRRKEQPEDTHRLVRETTTWTVEDER